MYVKKDGILREVKQLVHKSNNRYVVPNGVFLFNGKEYLRLLDEHTFLYSRGTDLVSVVGGKEYVTYSNVSPRTKRGAFYHNFDVHIIHDNDSSSSFVKKYDFHSGSRIASKRVTGVMEGILVREYDNETYVVMWNKSRINVFKDLGYSYTEGWSANVTGVTDAYAYGGQLIVASTDGRLRKYNIKTGGLVNSVSTLIASQSRKPDYVKINQSINNQYHIYVTAVGMDWACTDCSKYVFLKVRRADMGTITERSVNYTTNNYSTDFGVGVPHEDLERNRVYYTITQGEKIMLISHNTQTNALYPTTYTGGKNNTVLENGSIFYKNGNHISHKEIRFSPDVTSNIFGMTTINPNTIYTNDNNPDILPIIIPKGE